MSLTELLADLPGDPTWSMEQRFASAFTEAEREILLDGVDLDQLIWEWRFRARPAQYVDPLDLLVRVCILGAGRGAGKTLTGSQTLREVDEDPELTAMRTGGMGPLRFSLVGRTAADVRDVMIGGESGLLNIYPPSLQDHVIWTPSRREIILPNGAIGLTFSAEEPDQLRGPQSHITWADELSSWKQKPGSDGLTAWDNVRIGTRLGPNPFILVTTTPKRTPLIRKLWADAQDPATGVVLRKMRTTENTYLSRAYLDVLNDLYGGTSIGAQELDGELLEDVEGALLSEEILNAYRAGEIPAMRRPITILGLDPSVAERPQDECGIVVSTADGALPALKRNGYVVDDLSVRGSPSVWGKAVIRGADKYKVSAIVVEVNQGGSLLKRVLVEEARGLGLPVPRIVEIHARQNKQVRAAPVVSAAERGRVRVVGTLPELEDQWTSWVPGEAGYSPDRLDASVYSLLPLLFNDVKGASSVQPSRHDATPARTTYQLTATAMSTGAARINRGMDLTGTRRSR